MDDKSDLGKIKSSLQLLQVAIACLSVLGIALICTSSWLIVENQLYYKSLAALRDSNDILVEEVEVLKEWMREQTIDFFRNPGSTIQTESEVKSRQRRQSSNGQEISPVESHNGVEGLRGPPGRDGADGVNGEDGVDGRDGRDAVNFAAVDRHINATVAHITDQEMSKVRLAADEIAQPAGAVYTRWGRTVCPSTSDLVMKGIAAGTYWETQGGAAQYMCLPEDPDVSSIQPTTSFLSKISGVEYQYTNFPSGYMHDQNAPCVICQTKGKTVQSMFPAKSRCPDSTWTMEYAGFLMTEHDIVSHHRSEYVCVDSQPKSIPGHAHNTNGALWHHTVADCPSGEGALGACPPYTANNVILCVVCSK